MKMILTARCVCGEDVFSDYMGRNEKCMCGKLIHHSKFVHEEVADITSERLALSPDLTHRVPDIVKADHTCDPWNSPVACHFDTVTGPVDLMQCEICKKVWARKA